LLYRTGKKWRNTGHAVSHEAEAYRTITLPVGLQRRETWSLALKKVYTLRAFEKRVLTL
jgi:hypothetical protein